MEKRLFGVFGLMLCLAAPAQAEAPAVAVSIKPLHGLVAAVMQGVGTPTLIVAGIASPHTYSLKPSDAKALQAARLVVWVGKEFEIFLARPLAKRSDTLAMAGIPGMALLPTREGGVWEAEKHTGHPDDHDHGETDGHLWLDPVNAALLAGAVAERLSALDPGHAGVYAANLAAVKQRLAALDAGLRARLAPLAGRPYVVFHDAYQYLEHRYGLTPTGALTVDPERPPGARRMAQLRDRLKQAGAACVFREPRFAGATVQRLAEGAGARTGLLDPEGTMVEPGPDAYFTLMERLGDTLSECLSAG